MTKRKPWLLDRRTFMRGLGVTCSLPWLECMSSTARASSVTNDAAAEAPKRMCFLYVPNGVCLPPADNDYHDQWSWFPKGEGENYQFTQSLESLKPFREDISILGGLSHPRSQGSARAYRGRHVADRWRCARQPVSKQCLGRSSRGSEPWSLHSLPIAVAFNRWWSRIQVTGFDIVIRCFRFTDPDRASSARDF